MATVKKTYLLSLVLVMMAVVGIITAIVLATTGNDNGAKPLAPGNTAVTNMGFVYIPVISRTPAGFPPTMNAGVIVTEVFRDSPADKAGLKPGDMILSYNGTWITKDEPLFGVMRKCAGGTMIEIEILRDNAAQMMRVSCPAR